MRRPRLFTRLLVPGSAPRVGRVQHVVVVVLFKAEVHANAVPEAKQQLQLGIVAELDAPLNADRRPVKSARQVALLGKQLGQQVAGARRTASRSAVRAASSLSASDSRSRSSSALTR